MEYTLFLSIYSAFFLVTQKTQNYFCYVKLNYTSKIIYFICPLIVVTFVHIFHTLNITTIIE